jgi:hypothetical protein
MKQHRKSRRGNTIVEAAFALLLSLVILIGLIDFGQILMRQQAFVERVRAGCRYAVTLPFNEDMIRNVVVYGEPAPGFAPGTPGFFGLEPSMVAVSLEDPGAGAAERVTVQIHDYPLFLFTPGIAGTHLARPIAQTMTIESMGVTP